MYIHEFVAFVAFPSVPFSDWGAAELEWVETTGGIVLQISGGDSKVGVDGGVKKNASPPSNSSNVLPKQQIYTITE